MTRYRTAALAMLSMVVALPTNRAADPFFGADPAWTLIHEPVVEKELKLSSSRRLEFRRLLDGFDARFFPLRNMPPDQAAKAAKKALANLTSELESLLSKSQVRRLAEIQLRQQGPAALLGTGLESLMDYKPRQKEELEQVIGLTRVAAKELEQRLANGEARETVEKQYAALKQDEFKKVVDILSPTQKSIWAKSLGRDFDFTKLGHARFKSPEFIDSGGWLNCERALTLRSVTGKVVVLHFYAFGCINCIRNFPTYLDWQKRFQDRDVIIIGIHTPETAAEQNSASVKEKALEAGFQFPVLIDKTKANWNAWGNSMWPSVYLIDKQGYLRYFWPGELKWQGATGDVWMQSKIEELLSEPATRLDE